MKFLLYLIFLLIFIFLYILLKSMKKSLFATIICTLLIVHIILTPKLCIDSAILGASLFFYKVFPSLFPFLIISNIMMNYDGIQIYSKLFGRILCKPFRLPIQCTFAIVVSILCGYPLGAKYTCDLYEEGAIDYKTCEKLVNIASNTSPLFAIGAVGTAMLKSSYIGYLLLIINYLSCIVMGFIIPSKNINVKALNFQKTELKDVNIGNIVKRCMESSINTCLSIGGYVVLFSVVTNMIKSNILFDIAIKKISYITGINNELIGGFTLGLIEMTNGCNIISSISIDMYIKVIVISFLLAFSGLSIISQVYSFTYKYNLSMKKYILRKIIQGVIAAFISVIVYKIQIFNVTLETFNTNYNNNTSLIFIACIILLITSYSFGKMKSLFYTS